MALSRWRAPRIVINAGSGLTDEVVSLVRLTIDASDAVAVPRAALRQYVIQSIRRGSLGGFPPDQARARSRSRRRVRRRLQHAGLHAALGDLQGRQLPGPSREKILGSGMFPS